MKSKGTLETQQGTSACAEYTQINAEVFLLQMHYETQYQKGYETMHPGHMWTKGQQIHYTKIGLVFFALM